MKLIMMLSYSVEAGDTFASIAEKFDMKVGKLVSMNMEFAEGGSRSMHLIFQGELLRVQ